MTLRHEKELRDLQLKADADFRKAQVCSARHYLPMALGTC
jgi:mitotic spindle assembly checkpoint protein MAD1